MNASLYNLGRYTTNPFVAAELDIILTKARTAVLCSWPSN